MNIQKASNRVEKQRKSGKSKPLSAWGKACNIAFQKDDRVQDSIENIDYDEDELIVA